MCAQDQVALSRAAATTEMLPVSLPSRIIPPPPAIPVRRHVIQADGIYFRTTSLNGAEISPATSIGTRNPYRGRKGPAGYIAASYP